jgi:hypothetical protein
MQLARDSSWLPGGVRALSDGRVTARLVFPITSSPELGRRLNAANFAKLACRTARRPRPCSPTATSELVRLGLSSCPSALAMASRGLDSMSLALLLGWLIDRGLIGALALRSPANPETLLVRPRLQSSPSAVLAEAMALYPAPALAVHAAARRGHQPLRPSGRLQLVDALPRCSTRISSGRRTRSRGFMYL